MKRFAATERWNDEIGNRFRERFLAKYGVDLKKYIPQCENDFEAKWQLVEKAVFGDVELFEHFDEKYINQKIADILSGKSDGKIIFNAVNRYEFYEPDIWNAAAYTIRYLEKNKKLIQEAKKAKSSEQEDIRKYIGLNLFQMMESSINKDGKDIVYSDVNYFGNGFLKFVAKKKPDIFSFLFDKDSEKNIVPRSGEDVTRWTWSKILEVEKDTFRSPLLRKAADSKKKSSSVLIAMEDYVLFLKLANSELVRRVVPLYWDGSHIQFDIKFNVVTLYRLCEIESFSWQILLAEIKKQLEKNSNNIFPVYFGNDDVTFAVEKYKQLLVWESKILNEENIVIINKKRKFLAKAMIYLYMSSDEKIRPALFEEIQRIAIGYIDEMSTSTFFNVKDTVNTYIKSSKTENGKNGINENRTGEGEKDILPDKIDSFALMMIEDFENRIRKKKDEGIDKLRKTQLQIHENTLTALYVVLQKMIIQMTANHYGIGEKDNKVQSPKTSNLYQ